MSEWIKGLIVDSIKGWLIDHAMTIALWGGGALFLVLIVGTVIGKLTRHSGTLMIGAALLGGAAYLMRPAPKVRVVERVVDRVVDRVVEKPPPMAEAIVPVAELSKGKEEPPEESAEAAEAEIRRLEALERLEAKRQEMIARAEKDRKKEQARQAQLAKKAEFNRRNAAAKAALNGWIWDRMSEGNAAANAHQDLLRRQARGMGLP